MQSKIWIGTSDLGSHYYNERLLVVEDTHSTISHTLRIKFNTQNHCQAVLVWYTSSYGSTTCSSQLYIRQKCYEFIPINVDFVKTELERAVASDRSAVATNSILFLWVYGECHYTQLTVSPLSISVKPWLVNCGLVVAIAVGMAFISLH